MFHLFCPLLLACTAGAPAQDSVDAPQASPAEPALSSPAAGLFDWEWFPATQPKLASYLASINQYDDNCLRSGALFASDPVSEAAQWVKRELAKVGITYRLNQAYGLEVMSDVTRGKNVLNVYTMQLLANWVIFDSPDIGNTAGWIGLQANAGIGLGVNAQQQSPHQNIGAADWPNLGWVTPEAYISQLSWNQSFLDGSLVVQVGLMDTTLVIDTNEYANNQYAQLMNWAFVNSLVLPYSFNALGAVVQWQPCEWFYAMFATQANNTPAGRPPWYAVSGDYWSYMWEFGLVSEDTFGLGPGTYRLQPFYGTHQGRSGGGIALNVEQQLGAESSLGYFGRFGISSAALSMVNGASAQVATGLALSAPNFTGRIHNASDFLAAGFLWTQSSDPAAIHRDELGVEVTYVFSITPTLTLQPDLQVIWDPVYGTSDTNVVFQLQAVFTW